MNINRKIVSALAPMGLDIAEGLYEGKAKEYLYYVITLNYEADRGDNDSQGFIADVQIHYVCPWEKSYDATLKRARKLLHDAGFAGFNIVDLSDQKERLRHFVIECWTEDEYQMEE